MFNITPQYLAGVIDSDGSISISKHNFKNKNPHYRAVIQLTWRDIPECKKVMDYMVKKYGGKIYNQTGSKLAPNNKFLHYQLYDAKLLRFLDDVGEYMIVKKKQVIPVRELSFIKATKRYGRGHKHTEKEWENEEKLWIRVLKLNKSGKSKK